MGFKSIIKAVCIPVAIYAAISFIANSPSCTRSKPKTSKVYTVKSYEMETVKFDGELDYKTVSVTDEQIQRVKDIAKGDYKTVIRELKTPLEAMIYCTKVLEYKKDIEVFGTKDYWASFKVIHENKKDDCDGGAFAAAAILSDNGFPPYMAIAHNNNDKESGHAVFVYKTDKGKYGSIGVNKRDCISGCNSIDELKNRLNEITDKRYTHITVYDLRGCLDYINSDGNNRP